MSLAVVEVQACPACSFQGIIEQHPVLWVYECLFGLWTTLVVCAWYAAESDARSRPLRLITAVVVLISCSKAWLLEIPFLLWVDRKFGGLPQQPLFATIANEQGPAVLVGLLIGLLLPVRALFFDQAASLAYILAEFLPALTLLLVYSLLARSPDSAFWRIGVFAIVLLGPWLSMPVATLNRIDWWERARPHSQQFFIAGGAVDYLFGVLPWLLWIPVLVGVGALLLRRRIGAAQLIKAVIIVGLATLPFAVRESWQQLQKAHQTRISKAGAASSSALKPE